MDDSVLCTPGVDGRNKGGSGIVCCNGGSIGEMFGSMEVLVRGINNGRKRGSGVVCRSENAVEENRDSES